MLKPRVNPFRHNNGPRATRAALANHAGNEFNRWRSIRTVFAHAPQVVFGAGNHAALATPGIDREMVNPPRVICPQHHAVPAQMLLAGMLNHIAVDILPVGMGVAHVHQLLVAPGHVSAAQVRFVNSAGAPLKAAVITPAIPRNDGRKILAEGFQRTTVKTFLDCGTQVCQQGIAVGSGNHKLTVMRGAVDVCPGIGLRTELATEEGDLLAERQRAIADVTGHSFPPADRCVLPGRQRTWLHPECGHSHQATYRVSVPSDRRAARRRSQQSQPALLSD